MVWPGRIGRTERIGGIGWTVTGGKIGGRTGRIGMADALAGLVGLVGPGELGRACWDW